MSTSFSISIASTGTVPAAETIIEPSSERVTAANLQSRRIASSPASKEEVLAPLRVKFRDFPPLQIYLRADRNTPTKKIREFVEMATEVGAIDLIFGVHEN